MFDFDTAMWRFLGLLYQKQVVCCSFALVSSTRNGEESINYVIEGVYSDLGATARLMLRSGTQSGMHSKYDQGV